MKKGVSLFLAFVLAFGIYFSVPINASAAVADFEFELNEDRVSYTVTDFDSEIGGNIAVPGTYNQYPVTAIGESAFARCKKITSVMLPSTVTSIGKSAFYGCESLTDVWGTEQIVNIGDSAFSGCSKLQAFNIPVGLTSIGRSTFANCQSLTAIDIPENISEIGLGAFSHCTSLTSVIIPDSVSKIGASAFFACTSLENIVFPDSVTVIEEDVLGSCESLVDFKFSKNVSSIGAGALSNCSNLESFIIPDSISDIAGYTFSGCKSLKSVTIPESVVSIGEYAFSNCEALNTVNYKGPESKWTNVEIGTGNENLISAQISFSGVETIETPVSQFKATKDGVLVSWNEIKNATSYNIYRAESVNGVYGEWAKIASVSSDEFSYLDLTVVSGCIYKYAVSAVYGKYETEYNTQSSVVYIAQPQIVSTEFRKNGIAFTWNSVSGVEGYMVFKKTENGFENIAILNSSTTTFVDTNATINAVNTYAVASMDYYGNPGTYESIDINYVLPAVPVVKTSCEEKGINISWNDVENAQSYVVYRRVYNEKNKKWSGWSKLKVDCKDTEFLDTTVKIGVKYKYTVRAINGEVKSGFKSTGSVKYNVKPIVKLANAQNGIKVSWSSAANATGYIVYSSYYNNKTKTWSKWSNRGTTKAKTYSWVDKNVKTGTTYRYTVRALNGSLKSSYNDSPESIMYLAQPAVKISLSSTGIKVNWSKVTSAKNYRIYRAEYKNGSWSKWKSLTTLKSNVFTFNDKTVESGITYRYTVRAVNGKSLSSYKATTGLIYLAQPTVKIANAENGIKVSWNKIAGAEGYTVYSSYYNTKTKKWTSWSNRGTAKANKSSWVDKKVKEGIKYRYTVRAVNNGIKSTYKATSGLLYIAAPIVNVQKVSDGIYVSWNKCPIATGYIVYRSVLNDGEWSKWQNMGAIKSSVLSYSDKDIKDGLTYKYTVRAVKDKVKSGYIESSYIKSDGTIISLKQPSSWNNAFILDFYKTAVNDVAQNGKAGYTTVSWVEKKSFDANSNASVLESTISEFLVTEENAEPVTYEKGSAEAKECFPECTLTDLSKIKMAKAEALPNGNYKVTIVMQDENTPMNKETSFLGQVSNNIAYWEDIEKELKSVNLPVSFSIKDKSILYKEYTITAEITNAGRIVSLTHFTTLDMYVKMSVLGSNVESSFVGDTTIKYYDFKY